MEKRRLLVLSLLLFLLLPPALPAQALLPAGPALVVVALPDGQALARFERTGLPAYTRLPDGSLLTGADAAGQAALTQEGLSFRVLDADLAGGSYYLAFPAPGRPAPPWQEYGALLLLGRDYALLRAGPERAALLAQAGAELRRVTLTPKPLRAGRPGAAFPSTLQPDPLIQFMLDQVTTTTIYSYTGNISGEWPVLVGGQPYTITTRNTDLPPIEWAIQYAGEHLQGLGLDVEYHAWSAYGITSTNVIGEKQGLFNPDDVFIICAHLDDEPPGYTAPGADDNGSGSVAVLVAADILSQYQWGCTLRFALWTGEEQGLLGSYAYAQRAFESGENIVGVLNLDMVSWNTPLSPPNMLLEGNPTITPTLAMTELFSDVVAAYDLNLIPEIEMRYDSGSDHSSFWAFGYPAILAIEDGDDFNPYYHTTEDRLEHQDLAYYTDMVKAAVGTFAHMSGCLIPSGIGYVDGHVTVAGSGTPIAGARVAAEDVAGHTYTASTDPAGYYARTLLPGTYTVTASAYGYVTTTVSGVAVLTDTVTTLDIAMPTAVTYVVSGTVTAAEGGAPLPAEVSFLNTPVVALTDPATGFYSATVAQGHYTVRATSFGYGMAERALNVDHDQRQDWSLQKLPCVLLVDDDQDLADFRPYYTSALDLLGYPYDVWDVRTQGDPPAANIVGYPAVVWFTGYPDAGTVNLGNEAVLSTYLDAGGNLFLVSEGYLWDRGVNDFAQGRLGLGAFDVKVWDDELIAGNAGDAVGDGLGPYLPSPPLGWPWFFTADVTATQAAPFRWDSTGQDNSARYDGGRFKTVFLAWPLEGLPEVADRAEVLERVVDWFGGCVADGVLIGRVTDTANGTPLQGAALTAVPGPFTATAGLDGHYTLTLPAGPYSVTAAMAGYFSQTATLTVPAGLTVTQDFSLAAMPLPCEPLTATDFNWQPFTPTAGEVVTFNGWASGGWSTTTIDHGSDTALGTSLVLDAGDRPRIAYTDRTSGTLRYAWFDGSTWVTETVDQGGVDFDVSLALDSAGRPHIGYAGTWPREGLLHARYDGGSWITETVDDGVWLLESSLALDADDNPHISYLDFNAVVLKYASFDGTGWHTQTVTEGGLYSSLALDRAGRPHISHSSWIPGLEYAYNDGSTWHLETVDNTGQVGGTSIALDAAGRPHIAYFEYTYYDLRYAWYDGTDWHISTVDSMARTGPYPSLRLDGSGHPHISYQGWTDEDLGYAWHEGATWRSEVVDSTGDVGYFTSLALDSTGRAHISYGDATNHALKYAHQLPPPTVPITYTWAFGDGFGWSAPATLTHSITHTYALPSTYTVTLTATNACGQATAAHAVVVVPEEWRVYLPLVRK